LLPGSSCNQPVKLEEIFRRRVRTILPFVGYLTFTATPTKVAVPLPALNSTAGRNWTVVEHSPGTIDCARSNIIAPSSTTRKAARETVSVLWDTARRVISRLRNNEVAFGVERTLKGRQGWAAQSR
jgi:hypothetical protein